MRRRPPSPARLDVELPAEIAAGPSVALWAPPDSERPAWFHSAADVRWWAAQRAEARWREAGYEWNHANGFGHREWLDMLPEPVRYYVSLKGRLDRMQDDSAWSGWRP